VTALVAVTGYPVAESTATNTASGIVKHLFVTANSYSVQYGSAIPAFDYSFTGLDNSLATGAYKITCTTATPAIAVGTYTITCGPPPFTTSDLTDGISYTAGTLTITPATLTITAQSITAQGPIRGKTYGSTFTFAGTEFTTMGLLNSDTVTSVTLLSPGAPATATVGAYPIVPSAALGTNGLSNYTIIYSNGTLNVNPAPLTITAKNQTKTYGSAFTFAGTEFTVTGLLNTDAVSTVTLTSAGAAAGATVGAYPIVPSAAVGSGLGNYTITYATTGTLTVVGYTFTLTPPKSPAQLGSSVPINWTLQDGSGAFITDLSTVTKVDSYFNGSPPSGGCVASLTGPLLTLYTPATGAKGNSNLRNLSPGFQFNWDTTVNTSTGKGCYTVKISLKDGTAHATTPVQLK
jgi:hypothetical protein